MTLFKEKSLNLLNYDEVSKEELDDLLNTESNAGDLFYGKKK